jgi:hypothetical protein
LQSSPKAHWDVDVHAPATHEPMPCSPPPMQPSPSMQSPFSWQPGMHFLSTPPHTNAKGQCASSVQHSSPSSGSHSATDRHWLVVVSQNSPPESSPCSWQSSFDEQPDSGWQRPVALQNS